MTNERSSDRREGNIYLPSGVVKHFLDDRGSGGGSIRGADEVPRRLREARSGGDDALAKKNEPQGGFFLTHRNDFDISQSTF